GIAWWASGDAHRFAEVLVVATPCPLLIAAPVAFLGGMSRSARSGIIVKGSATLEQLARIRFVAFDKTGTLTEGKPALTRLAPAPGVTEEELLRAAASAEVFSSHVLAASVVDAAKRAGLGLLPVEDAEEEATNGVRATVQGREVRVGKAAWIAAHAPGFVPAPIATGELGIHVAIDGRPAGTIVMRDRVRPSAEATVRELRALGVTHQIMVTGDVRATAEPIAEGLGLDRLFAECLPEDKVRIVREAQPRPVLMVGDGLNDAPVLAAADVGFAMGARGATAASESADVVNLVDEVSRVGLAVRYGQETVRIALQAIWMGMIISVGLMLVAAFGFLPAIVGAWMQEIVDLVAILWALRALGPRGERGPSVTKRRGEPQLTAVPR
ncbi:HAD-IC family P-type ATPase, partial [Leucobacter sp. M11]|uniref:HAD-IC family P-type ATPase n=1 Tax=Leucobacter sp. M11 TaxID=2993565 RepID=UPI002D7EF4F5